MSSNRTPSFEKINYSLRPGKSVERRMISSALRRLIFFDHIRNYQYVGFGSTFFQDFSLFHKELSLDKLISIESEVDYEDRVNFNKPFKCIELVIGHSNDKLIEVNWNDYRTILWLDYDKGMVDSHFHDISTFFTLARSGSVFLITINCQGSSYGKDNLERQKRIKELIGEERLPLNAKLSDYTNSNIPFTLKRIFDNEIASILNDKNRALPIEEQIDYKQLFSFLYKDGARMMTIGGMLVNNNELKNFENANFKNLEFVIDSHDFFSIEVPNITLKEMRFLNSQLPAGINNEGQILDNELINILKPNIPINDIISYSKIYKYFPVFSETFII